MNVVAGYSVAKKNSRIFYGEEHHVFQTIGAKYTQLFGIFKSDYKGHGFETFSTEIINENGTDKLIFRKITGDPVVPAGKVSIKFLTVPTSQGEMVDCKI